MKLTVMSFNTQHCANFITRKIDFDAVADAIRSCGADIVGLQEIRDTGINLLEFRPQARILGEKLGFYHYFGEAIKFAGNNPYGKAILSRFPIVSAETVPIPAPKELRPFREKLFDTADKFPEPLLSFPSDKPERKIDYLFTSRDIKVLEADIPALVVSDHRPHTATIEI